MERLTKVIFGTGLMLLTGCIGASKRDVTDAADAATTATPTARSAAPASPEEDVITEEVAADNMLLRLKASDLTAGTLTTWSDASGKGHDAVQTNNSIKPQVVSSGGYKAVRFSGSQYLDITGHSDFDDQTISAVIAFKTNAAPSATNTLIHSKFSVHGGWSSYVQLDNQLAWETMDESLPLAQNAFGTPIQNNQKYVTSMVWGSDIETTMYGWLDSNYIYSVKCGSGCLEYPLSPNFSGSQVIRIGSDANHPEKALNGDIYEIRLYNRELTNEEREEIECKVASDNGIDIGC